MVSDKFPTDRSLPNRWPFSLKNCQVNVPSEHLASNGLHVRDHLISPCRLKGRSVILSNWPLMAVSSVRQLIRRPRFSKHTKLKANDKIMNWLDRSFSVNQVERVTANEEGIVSRPGAMIGLLALSQ